MERIRIGQSPRFRISGITNPTRILQNTDCETVILNFTLITCNTRIRIRICRPTSGYLAGPTVSEPDDTRGKCARGSGYDRVGFVDTARLSAAVTQTGHRNYVRTVLYCHRQHHLAAPLFTSRAYRLKARYSGRVKKPLSAECAPLPLRD